MRDESAWRAGFEVEVILGDLDDDRFINDLRDPMDTASPLYCQAVAKALHVCTGRPWTAPRKPPRKPGFYVVEEYDLDPLHWPYGRVAGVELLTPPLPLEEAQRVRDELIEAIHEIDGPFNFVRSECADDCAWHINIDAGDRFKLDHFITAVDEMPILAANNRLLSRYAAPQRHAYGVPLLRHIAADPGLGLLGWSGLSNLLIQHAGRGKRYAANFAKTDLGYLELRHFNALTFFTGGPLPQLIEPITRAFDMWAQDQGPFEEALLRRFVTIHEWLSALRHRLSWTEPPSGWTVTWHGEIHLDSQKIGDFEWNGSLEVRLTARRKYHYIGTIYDVEWPDIPEAIALMAMDYVDLHRAGLRAARSSSGKLQKLLDDLVAVFSETPDLYAPPPPIRHWSD